MEEKLLAPVTPPKSQVQTQVDLLEATTNLLITAVENLENRLSCVLVQPIPIKGIGEDGEELVNLASQIRQYRGAVIEQTSIINAIIERLEV